MTLMNILIDTGRNSQGCGRCTECKCKDDRPRQGHLHNPGAHGGHANRSLDQAAAAPAPASAPTPAA